MQSACTIKTVSDGEGEGLKQQKPHRLCVCLQLPDCKRLAELNLVKDTADGDDDLKYSGEDAQRVEDPLVSRQDAQPGQGCEDGGVKADTREAESSSQVVKHGQITWLEHTSVQMHLESMQS